MRIPVGGRHPLGSAFLLHLFFFAVSGFTPSFTTRYDPRYASTLPCRHRRILLILFTPTHHTLAIPLPSPIGTLPLHPLHPFIDILTPPSVALFERFSRIRSVRPCYLCVATTSQCVSSSGFTSTVPRRVTRGKFDGQELRSLRRTARGACEASMEGSDFGRWLQAFRQTSESTWI
ncbi:hypothetical protein C8Q76DRAFT_350855 [Earliella scabrosa]|nr:hypothetical protein C8Q76DRAFT_350855 [Earliella scabrosa]